MTTAIVIREMKGPRQPPWPGGTTVSQALLRATLFRRSLILLQGTYHLAISVQRRAIKDMTNV